LRVWYDEWTLHIGDSLRRRIDEGLAESRFGIVILSPHFFRKRWPQHELDGLVQREARGESVILPVWHSIGREEVEKYSLPLAHRVAGSTSEGLPRLAQQLLAVIRPGSPPETPPPLRSRRLRISPSPKTVRLGAIVGLIATVAVAALLAYSLLQIPVVRWGTTPYDTPAAIAARFDRPFAELARQVPDVRFTLAAPATDYAALYDLLLAGAIDIAGFSPYSYVQRRLDIEANSQVLQIIGKTNGNPIRTGVLAVNARSPLRSLLDLKNHPDATLVFGNQWSTSRSVVPQLVLAEVGVDLRSMGYEHAPTPDIAHRVRADPLGLTVGAFYSDELHGKSNLRILDGSEFPMPTEVVVFNKRRFRGLLGSDWETTWLPRIRAAFENVQFVYQLDIEGARRHIRDLEDLLFAPALVKESSTAETWIAEVLTDIDRWGVLNVGHRLPYFVFRRSSSRPTDARWPEVQWTYVGAGYSVRLVDGHAFEFQISNGAPAIGDRLFPQDKLPAPPRSVVSGNAGGRE
jgi:hypothetical protein